MEYRENYLYPRHGICADKGELKDRDLKLEDFETVKGAKDPHVKAACAACPVQVDCFDEAVDYAQRSMPILGIRAGIDTTAVAKIAENTVKLYETRERLTAQQDLARQALKTAG